MATEDTTTTGQNEEQPNDKPSEQSIEKLFSNSANNPDSTMMADYSPIENIESAQLVIPDNEELKNITEIELQKVIDNFQNRGITVAVIKQDDGNFTVRTSGGIL